jgi:hypothetical protein
MTVSALAAPAVPTKTARAKANRVRRMKEPPANVLRASLPLGWEVVSSQRPVSPRSNLRKWRTVAAGVFLTTVLSTPGRAEPPDISAQRLLASWREGDPGMKMLAEVIASAFASGMSWAGTIEGHPVYCPPTGAPLNGNQVMIALERFVTDHPDAADKTYGLALSASLAQAFPCAPGSTSR